VQDPHSSPEAGPQSDRPQPEYTPVSALSLRELRATMLQRAARTAVQARRCRARGDVVTAQALEEKASRLHEIARSVDVT
jgi:hypothetical protein